MSQEQKNTIRLKCQKRQHVIKLSGGDSDANDGGDQSYKKCKTMKYIQHTSSAFIVKVDILNIQVVSDTSSDGDATDGASNRSNKSLTHEKRGGVVR
jgi:hypothetical protein